jgi:ATP-dependent DNA helicase RecG
MPLVVKDIAAAQAEALLVLSEGQFVDMKSREIAPGKLTKHLSAFANSDGGQLFIGFEGADHGFQWQGFQNAEAANGHIQAFEEFFPLGQDFQYEFLGCEGKPGLLLTVTVIKTRDVRKASDGSPYVRRGAQSLPVKGAEQLQILQRAKGLISFEDSTVRSGIDEIANSTVTLKFMLSVVPDVEPEPWLRKQRLIDVSLPTVAGIVLFAEEPQVHLPKASVKIYRYKTSDPVGSRENLAFDPITIEGDIYSQIHAAVACTVKLTEEIEVLRDTGFEKIEYPHESLHEIITNALLHRDYAINDDVHIRIFDNRIEVESPGRLPAHITPTNILDERFARNPKIVRLINKFPNPPNKDVGEGLNTAFRAMQKLRLKEPQIVERDNSVLVNIRHERLASPEQQIVELCRDQGSVNNSEARRITAIQSEIQVRKLFKKLMDAGEIEQIVGTSRATTRYRIPTDRR